MNRKSRRYLGCGAFFVASLLTGAFAESASAVEPPYIDPSADWLTTVNYFRAMAGVPPVVDNATWSAGAYNHSCYMLYNGIAHDEVPGKPGYTPEGDEAGNNGNVAVSSVLGESARRHIELWMTGPFHAIGVIRPNLVAAGFGKCDNAGTSPWRSGATLDILHGLAPAQPQAAPIVFPGHGTTTSLTRFITESPNPLDFCGWAAPAGLPIIALMPEGSTAPPSATVSSPSGPIEVCVLSSKNTSGVAQQILAGNNSVIIVPRNPLATDTYSISVTTSARTVNWSFNVDPAASTGVQPAPAPPPQSVPAPSTTPLSSGTGLFALSPTRFVDTRLNQGATRLVGTLPKRVQIAGFNGVPDDAKAVSANFTITDPESGGYLTVWNCSGDRPVVSTLNYGAGQTVPNGASVPLDATGGLCVYSLSSADLLIDVNAFYAPKGGGKFASVEPTRLLDTRVGLGAGGRLAAGNTQPLQVTGVAGVPGNASLVTLNVTSVFPSEAGFVTVYPCDSPRPTVSSLNPVPGSVKPNIVITPIAADGTVCLYTLTEVDLIVDITGFVGTAGSMKFTSASPFRLTDTRDNFHPEMQAGTNGAPAGLGQTLTIQVAGSRGIAANAKAVSANFTVIGGVGPGFVTAFPCGAPPATSTVNYVAVEAVANGGQIPLSPSGQLCIFVSNNVHVIVDVNGWWV